MYAILWEAFLDPSDSYFLFVDLVGFYTHWTYYAHFSSHFSQQLLIAYLRGPVWKFSISHWSSKRHGAATDLTVILEKYSLKQLVQMICLMVFNATFNNISVISRVSFIGGGNPRTLRKPPTCCKSLINFIT
jgi:hypothetical protein